MRRLFTIRQVAVIVAVTLVFSVGASAFVFRSVRAAGERYTITFDADSVDYRNVVKFNRVMDILKNDF